MKKSVKQFIIKFLAVLCLIGLVMSAMPFLYTAKAATMEENIKNSIVPAECKEVLINGDPVRKIKGFEPELKSFLEFLDTNFKNKSSTSSLTELAIARYSEYRQSLRDQFNKLQISGFTAAEKAAANKNGGSLTQRIQTFDQTMNQYALCEELVNTYISAGRTQMLSHIKTAAAQKKTIMLVEKFKVLNGNLRALNMKIAEMYGLFATFENKFPGFICKKCMKTIPM
jgi:hypothetical protein